MNTNTGSWKRSACADGSGGADALPNILVTEEDIKERLRSGRGQGGAMDVVMDVVQEILGLGNLIISPDTTIAPGVNEIILQCTKPGRKSFIIEYTRNDIQHRHSEERTGLWPSVVKELEAIFGVSNNPRIVGGLDVMVLVRNQSFYRIVRYQRPPVSLSGDTSVERVEIFLHQGEYLYKPF